MNIETIEKLYGLSKKGLNNAYAPYSKFRVGAALITYDGKAFIGSNIENAAYGSTMCAERSCIYSAYANGVVKNDIAAFALITDTKSFTMPCAACLQVLNELMNRDVPILIFNSIGEYENMDLKTLLPHAFNESSMNDV